MTTQTSAHDQLAKELIELPKEPAKYIAVASLIMVGVLQEHPEEMPKMFNIGISLLLKFTKDQFREALALIEKAKENVITEKTPCDGLSKESACDLYDETIAFMKYHFIDD